MPLSFGQARIGALAWLFSFAQKDSRLEEYLAAYKKPVDAASPSPRAMWDWIYLTQIRNDGKEFYRTCKLLAQSGEPLAQAMYLHSLSGRIGQSEVVTTRTATGQQPVDRTPPLAADEIELMLKCYRGVSKLAQSSEEIASYSFNQFYSIGDYRAKPREADRTRRRAAPGGDRAGARRSGARDGGQPRRPKRQQG